MGRKPTPELSDEDRVLWNLVARSTTPLKGRRAAEEPSNSSMGAVPMSMGEALHRIEASRPPASPARPHRPVGHSLDAPTHDKLAKGRLPIEGRVDLHGMTQAQAHSLLLSFLRRAHAGGVRYVLIITGKGSSSGGEGVLRRVVPGWLATAPFRALVSSHDHAARNHGGAGALYVRLRRHPAPRS